jgi:nucleoside 2-deoxyribosyltransferase
MMQFGQTKAHTEITEAVRTGLEAHGIKGIRADDKRYHDNLFYNVLTYMHGCGLGMAIYERIETQTPNPNVALEVGYLFAMRKPVCLLKDQTLTTLPADLVGQLYDPFDIQDPGRTIPPLVSRWLSDKGLA